MTKSLLGWRELPGGLSGIFVDPVVLKLHLILDMDMDMDLIDKGAHQDTDPVLVPVEIDRALLAPLAMETWMARLRLDLASNLS